MQLLADFARNCMMAVFPEGARRFFALVVCLRRDSTICCTVSAIRLRPISAPGGEHGSISPCCRVAEGHNASWLQITYAGNGADRARTLARIFLDGSDE